MDGRLCTGVKIRESSQATVVAGVPAGPRFGKKSIRNPIKASIFARQTRNSSLADRMFPLIGPAETPAPTGALSQ